MLRAALIPLMAGALFWQGAAAAALPYPESLPNLGQPANAKVSPAKALSISNQVVGAMYGADYIVTDPQLENLVNSVGWRLAVHGTTHPPAFRFFVLADNDINAMTLPAATIGVNAGTIVAASNISELAAVMAHEEAHVTQNHVAREMARSPLGSIETWAGVLAVMAAAAATGSGGQALEGGLLSGEAINAQRTINYTRGHEMTADRVGIETLARSGYDPMAMAHFFVKMEKQSQLYGFVPQALVNHPVDSTRIAEATERAERYPAVRVPYSIGFALLRARARVLEANLSSDALAWFERELASGHDTPGSHYGYAMSLHELGRNHQALVALRPLLAAWPTQRNVLLLQSRIYRGLGQNARALQIDQRVLKADPDYAPAILRTAADLIANGQPHQARNVLLGHQASYGTSPVRWQLLARTDLAAHDEASAAFDMSSYYLAREQPLSAVRELDAGLRLGHINSDARDRLEARRQQLLASLSSHQVQELRKGRSTGER